VNPIGVGCIVLVCVFGGAMLGMAIRTLLPEHHLNTESKDVIKLGMGLIATMSALVLALLTNSAKGSYDTQRNEITQLSANILLLDRVLAHYGPETKEARDVLRDAVVSNLDRTWPQERRLVSAPGPPSIGAEALLDKIQALSPKNDKQRSLQSQALTMAIGLGQTRWLMYEQGAGSISKPMLIALVFWLTAIFTSFGLSAPRNATVATALIVSALSVSGAIFLIQEMYTPFSGLIQISSTPLRAALTHLGQ